jgi:hypothetical protein
VTISRSRISKLVKLIAQLSALVGNLTGPGLHSNFQGLLYPNWPKMEVGLLIVVISFLTSCSQGVRPKSLTEETRETLTLLLNPTYRKGTRVDEQ